MADLSSASTVVRIVPGSTATRVMLEVQEYLAYKVESGGASGQEKYLLQVVSESIQVHPKENGADLISVERAEQLFSKGFTTEHDDSHMGGELIEAARAYALMAEALLYSETCVTFSDVRIGKAPGDWPWSRADWKPNKKDPIPNLVKAGALIAAEIDRLQRVPR